MFENEKVKHVKFGEGNVVECDGTHIRILFQCENIEKTFTYPTVFEKFVRFDSQDAQDRVTDDLNTAKEEAAKLENLRKLFMAEQAKNLLADTGQITFKFVEIRLPQSHWL